MVPVLYSGIKRRNRFMYTTGSGALMKVRSLFGFNSAVKNKRMTHQLTDGWTDGRTDGQTLI
jgi:hypothetical protein